jgi:hypothetical protein
MFINVSEERVASTFRVEVRTEAGTLSRYIHTTFIHIWLIFYPEDGGITFLQNIGVTFQKTRNPSSFTLLFLTVTKLATTVFLYSNCLLLE